MFRSRLYQSAWISFDHVIIFFITRQEKRRADKMIRYNIRQRILRFPLWRILPISPPGSAWGAGSAWVEVMHTDGESWFHLLPLPVQCWGCCASTSVGGAGVLVWGGVSPIAMMPQSEGSHSCLHSARYQASLLLSNTTCPQQTFEHLARCQICPHHSNLCSASVYQVKSALSVCWFL